MMVTDENGSWTVTMHVFSFATKEEACDFRDALYSAFCAMPEAEGYGNLTSVQFERDDDAGN